MKPYTVVERWENAGMIFGILLPSFLVASALYLNRDTYHSPARIEHAAISRELSSFALTLPHSPQRLSNIFAFSAAAQYALMPCRSTLTSPAESYDAARAALCVRRQADLQEKMSNIYSDMAHYGIVTIPASMLFVSIPFALLAGATARRWQRKGPSPAQPVAG